MKKYLIVGCGITGIILANRIANELKKEVLIIDLRDHIGGNCFDYLDNNIYVHKYGTHIFHTDNQKVWNYLSNFTKWHFYMHKVKAVIEGIEVPIPFNLNSIHLLFPQQLANKIEEKLIDNFNFGTKVPILELKKTNDKDLHVLAEYVYKHAFLGYTLKQWGITPEELDPLVTGRVPVYISKDDRYFQNKYQAIPINGYTKMFEEMLNNPLITVQLNTDFIQYKNKLQNFEKVFYTGAIDEYFDYKFGKLPYRSLNLEFQTINKEFYQDNSVINYSENYDFTRIGEYKYFLASKSDKTIISFEYPEEFIKDKNERCYPIINEKNNKLYQEYSNEAKSLKNVIFLGRLGDYKYYDMDKAIERTLNINL